MKKLFKRIIPIFDVIFISFVPISAILLKIVRRIGLQHLPITRKILVSLGLLPIRDHYYEPLFNKKHLLHPLDTKRRLPGIDWNIKEQLATIKSFAFVKELDNLWSSEIPKSDFYLNTEFFCKTDASIWYSMIRLKKPKRILEIGSGSSTLMAIHAIEQNKKENSKYKCTHTCIEPYEMPWLEKTGVNVIRKKVELLDESIFKELKTNDILFIDSSHMIRPQGDVLFEYLQILPILNKGVIVHIHDIFSPRDYLDEWVNKQLILWNEQYLLEAFLTSNKEWKIIAALNYLYNDYDLNSKLSPISSSSAEPGSFYIQKIM